MSFLLSRRCKSTKAHVHCYHETIVIIVLQWKQVRQMAVSARPELRWNCYRLGVIDAHTSLRKLMKTVQHDVSRGMQRIHQGGGRLWRGGEFDMSRWFWTLQRPDCGVVVVEWCKNSKTFVYLSWRWHSGVCTFVATVRYRKMMLAITEAMKYKYLIPLLVRNLSIGDNTDTFKATSGIVCQLVVFHNSAYHILFGVCRKYGLNLDSWEKFGDIIIIWPFLHK